MRMIIISVQGRIGTLGHGEVAEERDGKTGDQGSIGSRRVVKRSSRGCAEGGRQVSRHI